MSDKKNFEEVRTRINALHHAGEDFDEAKENVFNGFFEQKGINDPEAQKDFKKGYDAFIAKEEEDKATEAKKAQDKEAKKAAKEADREAVAARKAAEDAEREADVARKNQEWLAKKAAEEAAAAEKKQDKQIANLWKEFGSKVGKGIDADKAKAEVLGEFCDKNNIKDPEDKEAFEQKFNTYHQRKAEKEAKADAENKKSGKKKLDCGVVSKWFAKNKTKAAAAVAALGLGAAGIASGLSSAAGLGGLGMLPVFYVAGVSSAVFPPIIGGVAVAAAAGYLVHKYKQHKDAKTEEGGPEVAAQKTNKRERLLKFLKGPSGNWI